MNRRILAASIGICLIVPLLVVPFVVPRFHYFPDGPGDGILTKGTMSPAAVPTWSGHDEAEDDSVASAVGALRSSHVMPGDRVIQTAVTYGVQYDRVGYDDRLPVWKIDDVAVPEVSEVSSERQMLYAAMTTRPFTIDEMLRAISYGADLNAAPVTNLSGEAQAQDLRGAWTSQSLLQWQSTHQQLAAQYAAQVQQAQVSRANQVAASSTSMAP